MGWFRIGVALTLIVLNVGVFLTFVIGITLPLCTFDNLGKHITMWTNCSLGIAHCGDFDYSCGQARTRFDVARAFGILTVLLSSFCVACAVMALVQLLCYKNLDSAAAGLRGSIYGGLLTMIFSLVALALSVVISVEPLCEGRTKLEDLSGWQVGNAVVALAVGAAFSLIASCFGRVMEPRISTSKIGV